MIARFLMLVNTQISVMTLCKLCKNEKLSNHKALRTWAVRNWGGGKYMQFNTKALSQIYKIGHYHL